MDISHILEFENGKATYKFFRFASLVPKGEDDQNDGTFIENGTFIGLTIGIITIFICGIYFIKKKVLINK